MTYIIVLKVTKFDEDSSTVFEIFRRNSQGGAFCPDIPSPFKVKSIGVIPNGGGGGGGHLNIVLCAMCRFSGRYF